MPRDGAALDPAQLLTTLPNFCSPPCPTLALQLLRLCESSPNGPLPHGKGLWQVPLSSPTLLHNIDRAHDRALGQEQRGTRPPM